MAIQHLREGLDPTGLACISVSQLLQMIRNAQPYPHQGMFIWSDVSPDVVTNPELADFLWGYQVDMTDDTTRTNDIYYYNGTSWELIPLEILDGSIGLIKIDLSGASVYDILQVVAGPTLTWTDIVSAVQNNSLPPTKILVPNNTDTFILSAFAGVQAFTELVAFFAAIADNAIPTTKLIKGGADALKLWLSTKADGSAIEWSEIDIANIAAAGYTASQALRRKSDNSGWEGYTPATGVPTPLAPTTVYTGGAVGWTAPGAAIVPTDATWAILQVDCQNTDVSDGYVRVDVRKETAGDVYVACYTAGVGGTGTASSQQGFYPVKAGNLEYQVVASVTCLVNIKVVGWI